MVGTCFNQERVDSLKKVMIHAEDTAKFYVLHEISEEYSWEDSAKCRHFFMESLRYAREINYPRGEGWAMVTWGRFYSRHGEPELAQGRFDEALEIYQRCDSKSGMATVWLNKGAGYYTMGKMKLALKSNLKSLELWQTLGREDGMAACLNSIGSVNLSMKEYSSARGYYQQALELNKKLGNQLNAIGNIKNIASIDALTGNHNEALNGFNRTLELYREIGERFNMSGSFMNLAKLYQMMGQHRMALSQLDSAKAILQAYNSRARLAFIYNLQAEPLARLGEEDKAIEGLKVSLQITDSIPLPEVRLETLRLLKVMYGIKGDHESALGYYEAYVVLNDSIFASEKVEAFAEMQTKYETQLKEAQNLQLKATTQLQELELKNRNFLLSVIIAILLLLALLGTFLYMRKSYRSKQEAAELARNAAELQQQLLRSQMNPHFVFNAMNSIQSFVMQNEKKIANSYLSKFANLMRTVLENSRETTISLEEELEALRLYIELEELRFEHQFTYQITIDDDVDVEGTRVPPLIIQPYVENAIQHGLFPKAGPGKLSVEVQAETDYLRIAIADNGIGRVRSRELNQGRQHKKSLGMNITRDRLEFLNRDRTNRISVQVSDRYDTNDEADGTLVEIFVPFSG